MVPEHWWPNKIAFHFYLSFAIVLHQFFWGVTIMPWTGKFRMVCILTTLMQFLRGENIADPKNYDHSFLKELFGKAGFNFTHRMAVGMALIVLTLVSWQYLSLKI